MTTRTGMTTLSMTVRNDLKIKAQDNEFTNKDSLTRLKGKLPAQNEIKIIKTYRFESGSNLSDQDIIYLVIANDGTIGYSLDAYGVYTNHIAGDGFAKQLTIWPCLNAINVHAKS